MRLWTIHPRYLDAKGLVAVWREALLAQKVLQGRTAGYRHHPQLIRFRQHSRPVAVIAAYLRHILQEAVSRGYHFNGKKISRSHFSGSLMETDGQLLYEWQHLKRKLRLRDYQHYLALQLIENPKPHPLFRMRNGPPRDWERMK
ncbi:MAG: DNA lyase [Ignavibacteriae bacterium]|nr:MAG: DNA lyase [Ignavibacteriota bacterium]